MRAAAAQGWDVTIVSSDKDLMQLVGGVEEGPRIDMLDTMKNIRIFLPEVAENLASPPTGSAMCSR
jgi:DNA polymerase-1